jgi:hypothetical protein
LTQIKPLTSLPQFAEHRLADEYQKPRKMRQATRAILLMAIGFRISTRHTALRDCRDAATRIARRQLGTRF